MDPTLSTEAATRPPGVRRAALRFAQTVARQGLVFSALPAVALPGRLRRKVFGSARVASRLGAGLPGPLAEVLSGFAEELEVLEASLSGREDLGTRRRREARQGGNRSENRLD